MQRTDPRRDALLDWLKNDLHLEIETLVPASSDASFRRYFRFDLGNETRIAMDAPPPQENIIPFLKTAELLRTRGVPTPEIFAANADQGFIVLGDFGRTAYLDILDPTTVEALYASALETLLRLQTSQDPGGEAPELPRYDEALLRRELGVFREWCIDGYLGLTLSAAEEALLAATFDTLVQSALSQPTVIVHRDYHSRNLMHLADGGTGVLDFQDAVIGPVTYDLASLLRDCYIAWPLPKLNDWIEGYRERLAHAGLIGDTDESQFRRWFDLMGLQRHLKATGIFCRLKLRDGKPGYIGDIPRTLGYALDVGRDQPDLAAFATFIATRVLPPFLETAKP
jgi:aminoglycoside/choline kinase family phosphotransferase